MGAIDEVERGGWFGTWLGCQKQRFRRACLLEEALHIGWRPHGNKATAEAVLDARILAPLSGDGRVWTRLVEWWGKKPGEIQPGHVGPAQGLPVPVAARTNDDWDGDAQCGQNEQ